VATAQLAIQLCFLISGARELLAGKMADQQEPAAPSKDVQAAAIAQALGESFAPELGTAYFVVNQEWYNAWKRYSQNESEDVPGVINNSEFSENGCPEALRRGLVSKTDTSRIYDFTVDRKFLC
jgi:hypothetical protein